MSKKHVWRRYISPPNRWVAFCGKEFESHGDDVVTIYENLDEATCVRCLRAVRDHHLHQAQQSATIAQVATQAHDKEQRKARRRKRSVRK